MTVAKPSNRRSSPLFSVLQAVQRLDLARLAPVIAFAYSLPREEKREGSPHVCTGRRAPRAPIDLHLTYEEAVDAN